MEKQNELKEISLDFSMLAVTKQLIIYDVVLSLF